MSEHAETANSARFGGAALQPYYEDNNCAIYNGDCRDVLPGLGVSVDLLLTDPPYGAGFTPAGTSQQAVAADGPRQGVRVVRQMLHEAEHLWARDVHALVFCHWESWPDFYDAICPRFQIRNALIWHKAAGGTGNVKVNYLRDYEVVLYGARGKRPIGGEGRFSNVLSGFRRVRERTHPTEKPTDLLTQLATRHAPEGGLVLDPFMGTGSTLVASVSAGRKAIGIEIDESYCEIAAERLSRGVLDFGGVA